MVEGDSPLLNASFSQRVSFTLPSAKMPPKSAHSQPVTSGAQQSRFGRTLKVTERAKDGCKSFVERILFTNLYRDHSGS